MRNYQRLDADGSRYYYMYNVNDEAVEFTTILSGEGTPYILNTWTSEITPLALYSRGNRGIKTRLKLGDKGSTIIAITKDTATFGPTPGYHIAESDMDVKEVNGKILGIAGKAGTYEYNVVGGKSKRVSVPDVGKKLVLDTWDIEIESWGPGDNKDRPIHSKATMIPVGSTKLVSWDKLSVPMDKMAKAGVEIIPHGTVERKK